MNKTIRLVLLPAILSLLLLSLSLQTIRRNAAASPAAAPPAGTDIYTTRTMGNGRPSGVVNTSHLGVFGPNICTSFGDPFSPWNSPWAPGSYTYRFRIRIPPDYPSDILRVELFDPDSINQITSTTAVSFTALAQTLAPVTFPAGGRTLSCSSTNRREPCLINTGELNLVNPPVELDQINLYWFLRVDTNQGTGAPPGSGACGNPASYNPAFNTNTLYELYYYDSAVNRVNLASYTGQTGDGVRDNGDHQTDLRWVSPGGTQLADQPAAVPVNPGSAADFELDLIQDMPGIFTDPDTGDRYLYLDVTALSGASENGFDIWAGPLYANSASDVNGRNLQIVNDPDSHSAQGVVVTALDYLPENSNVNFAADIPLTYVDATQAGQSIYVSLFDSDAGAQPPLIFYFDTIAESDWSLTFGAGDPDPDGVSDRCKPGNCYSIWVDPPYNIQIPTLTGDCDLANPDPQLCTPFPGGRLMARYIGGAQDTHAWQINAPTAPSTQTTGCSAFPIGVNELSRSVTPPGAGANPYPDAADFEYPAAPPAYDDFWRHTPDITLPNAQPGDVFKVQYGMNPGNFSWLLWNNIYQVGNSTTLSRSLTWPGDSLDYPEYGYYEPGDPTDTALQIGDSVWANIGATNAITPVLAGHVDLGRVLRLPVWDNLAGSGSSISYQMSGFTLFRVQGFNLAQGWLLLEFLGWDESCGQRTTPAAPADLVVSTPQLVTTTPITAYEPVDFRVTVSNVGYIDANAQFFVDVFIDPTAVYSTSIPIGQSDGYVAIGSLAAGASKVVTITAAAGFANLPSNHLVYAMADSQAQISEGDEANNVAAPLTVSNVIPISPTLTLLPDCAAGPDAQFQLMGANWPTNETINLYWGTNNLQSTLNTSGSTSFTQTWTKTGLSNGSYEVVAIGQTGPTATAVFTIPCPGPVPSSVAISGPAQGIISRTYTFTATISPVTAVTPFTYTWEATGQTAVTRTLSALTDVVSYTWSVTGTKTITVTAVNPLGGPIETTQTFTAVKPWRIYLPLVFR